MYIYSRTNMNTINFVYFAKKQLYIEGMHRARKSVETMKAFAKNR